MKAAAHTKATLAACAAHIARSRFTKEPLPHSDPTKPEISFYLIPPGKEAIYA